MSRQSFKFRRAREQVVQGFQVPHVESSFRYLFTQFIPGDPGPTISLRSLDEAFGGFNHIEASGVLRPPLQEPFTPNIDTLQDIEQLESWECNDAFNIHDGHGLQGEDGPEENHDGYLTDGDDLLDYSDIQETSYFNYSLINLNDTGNEQGMQSDMTLKPPVDDESLLSADSNSLTVTNTAEPISGTGCSSTPPSNNTTTALNQAVQTFRFTRPPPSKLLSSDIPADGAGLKPPQLDIATEEFIVPETTFPQNFFILPQERTTGPEIDPQDQFNFFRMCVCGPNISAKYVWVPHLLDEQRPPVRKPYEFIDLFAPALLVNTRLILCSLRISLNSMDSSSMPLPEVPFTHPCQAAKHIQEVLNLVNIDAVEPLLEKMIRYLEKRLNQRANTSDLQQPHTPRHPLFERYQLSSENKELLPKYVDLPDADPPSAYLISDEDGNDLCVCVHHYRCLDPGFRLNYVKNALKPFGQYDAATGKIDVHLRSPKHLAAVSKIDPAKAGYVTQLYVTLGWRLSPPELASLAKCAANLNLGAVSVTGTSTGAGPSSAASQSNSSRDAETAYGKNLLHELLVDMTYVTFNCDSNFNTFALLQSVPLRKRGHIFLTLKSDRREVSSILYSNHVIDHVKSNIESLPLKEGGSVLAGNIQNLTVVSDFFPSDEEQASVWGTVLSEVIQENLALSSLTINCKIQDFRTAYDILRPILQDRNSLLSMRKHRCFLVLKDSIPNEIIAKFNFVPLDYERPVTVDVTAGTNGRTLLPVISMFGAVIRVLNLLDSTANSALVLKNFARAKPAQLVSLMLPLDNYVAQSGPDLSAIIAFSKDTFKQLILIGHPWTLEATSSLIKVVESLRGCEVVLISRAETRTMKMWIGKVRAVVHEGSRVFDDDSIGNVRLMIPGLSDSALASMRAAVECKQSPPCEAPKVAPDIGDAIVDYTSFSL